MFLKRFKRRHRLFISGPFIFLLLSLVFSFPDVADLSKFLPREGEAGAWKPVGEVQAFRGDDLYIYINGGAEIYHEYGFKQAVVQDYQSQKGKELSLEIFEMKTPESAYGMFTFKKSVSGKEVEVGGEGQLADYYLNFWKGNYVVTITGFDDEKDTIEGLLQVARAADKKIEERSAKPGLLSLLPDTDLSTTSLKYFRGPLGLYNSYAFFSRNIFAFAEGVKADSKSGYSLFILKYGAEPEGRSKWPEIQTAFRESRKYADFKDYPDTLFSVTDDKGKRVLVSLLHEYLLMAVGLEDLSVFESLRLEIQAKAKQIDRTGIPGKITTLFPRKDS